MSVEHNPRCAIFHEPPSLRDPNDCNCGAIPPLERVPSYDELMTTCNLAMAQRDAAVRFIVREFIANEVGFPAYPAELKEPIAKELVSNPFMGWPNIEDAMAFLEESFRWD